MLAFRIQHLTSQGAPNFSATRRKVRNLAMSLNKAEHDELLEHAKRILRGVPIEERKDLVQEAIVRALKSAPGTAGSELVELAKTLLPKVRNDERNRGRRDRTIHRASREEASREGTLRPVRRARRRPHVPKGLVSVHAPTGRDAIPIETADLPDAELVAAVRRLQSEVIRPALLGMPVPPAHRQLVLDAHERAFGGPPSAEWASILTSEIHEVRRQELVLALEKADPNTVPEHSSVNITKTRDGHERFPDLPAAFEKKVRLALIRRWGDEALVALMGELDGQERVLSYMMGSCAPPLTEAAFASPEARADAVLVRTLARLAQLEAGPLPEYVVDRELIDLLIERAGFEGGGGAQGKLSRDRIASLLLDPVALADEVERFGERQADRFGEEDANRVERKYAALAARIRATLDRE
jgi:DNA-directed RNA polymerase specialized sigma24 family protein